jgi:hypothetical protein
MFDIVAADDDELPLPVDLEGVDDTEPLLAGAPARQFDPAAENHTKQDEDKRHANEKAHRRQDERECTILSESTHELHVLGSLRSAGKRIKLS